MRFFNARSRVTTDRRAALSFRIRLTDFVRSCSCRLFMFILIVFGERFNSARCRLEPRSNFDQRHRMTDRQVSIFASTERGTAAVSATDNGLFFFLVSHMQGAIAHRPRETKCVQFIVGA